MLANCRSQFLLDRLRRCLKLFVSTDSTSSHEVVSQFGLEVFYTRKTPKTIANTESPARMFIWMKPWSAIDHQHHRRKGGVNSVMVGRTDPSNSDNRNGVCVCACVMCLQYSIIYGNNIWPRLIMIIMKFIILYFTEIAHTDDDFP